MRKTSSWTACLTRPGLAVRTFVFATIAFGGPVWAQQDIAVDEPTMDQRVIRNILTGIGLQVGGRPDIDYRERSPLVVPPSRGNLPDPNAANAQPNDPAWPVDADTKRRQQAARDRRARHPENDPAFWEGQRLSPSEMAAGRSSSPTNAARTDNIESTVMPPRQLGYTGNLFNIGNMFGAKKNNQDQATFTREPPRTSLTEPPPGYQTPSPAYTYGLGGSNIRREPIRPAYGEGE